MAEKEKGASQCKTKPTETKATGKPAPVKPAAKGTAAPQKPKGK